MKCINQFAVFKSYSFLKFFVISVVFLLNNPASAELRFEFNYIDPNRTGFLDPAFGIERQFALQQSSEKVAQHFTNYDATIQFDVVSQFDTQSNELASAVSELGTVGLNGSQDPFRYTLLQQKILTGDDVNGASADGVINWNFAHDWGLGDSIAQDEFDFQSTAMHELLHSLGYTSFVSEGGIGGMSSPGFPDLWSSNDQFLVDNNGERLIDSMGVFDPSKIEVLTAGTELNDSVSTGNGVFFNGANAVRENGGELVNIYSPNPFSEGSSISHLDDTFFTDDMFLMEAWMSTGKGVRNLSLLELGILKDIGYSMIVDLDNVSNVPVPAAIWLMSSGLLFLFGKHRKSWKDNQ